MQRLAGAHDVVQRLERLLDRHVVVPAMDLVEIDVVGAEPLQAGVDLGQDRLARQAGAVRPLAHAAVDLGRDHHLVAPREVEQRAADDLFAGAVRIDVGGVEEVDAEVERLLDERPARRLAERPRVVAALGLAVAHAAQADARDVEAGAAELDVVHGCSARSAVGGLPGGTRTPDLLLRRQLLYPVELRAARAGGGRSWSGRRDSNSRPTGPKPVALPGCATPRTRAIVAGGRRADGSARLVGGGRRGQQQLPRDRDALLDVLLADVAQRRIGERRRDRLAGDRHVLGGLLRRQPHADQPQRRASRARASPACRSACRRRPRSPCRRRPGDRARAARSAPASGRRRG